MADPRKVPFVTLASFGAAPPADSRKRPREDETGTGGGRTGAGTFGSSAAARTVTVRLNLSLAEPSAQSSSEFNYGELIQASQVKKTPPGLTPLGLTPPGLTPLGLTPQGLTPSLDPSDPFADETKERQEVEALARKFESKYGNSGKKKKKDRIQDLVDIGYGYDETDPFIDNSEAYDELVPASLTTKLGGFYINTGTLQFRAASDSEGDESGNHFKKVNDGQEAVLKKRKKKQDGNSEEKKPAKNRVPKQGVSVLSRPEKKKQKKRKKLMADSLHLAAMLRRFSREKEELRKKNAASVKPAPGVPSANCANSYAYSANAAAAAAPDVSIADLTSDPAVMSLLGAAGDKEILQDLMVDLDFGLLDSPQPASPGENGGPAPAGQKAAGCSANRAGRSLVPPPPLPAGLPAPLTKRIEDLRAASRQFDEEGRKKFFTLDMNNILLDIELQVQEQPVPLRAAVYSHLEAFVPCNKEALLKRLKKLSLHVQDDRVRTPLMNLKLAVCSVMPEQIGRYNMDCLAKARQQSEEGEKNGSEEEDEEKPGKRVMGPRKKFIWDDKLRNLLCSLVRVKLSCYELEGQTSLSAEDYLKAFLETEVKPLWPKGWMQARMLFKESRLAHSHLTGNSAKKKIVPPPKPKIKDAVWVQRSTPLAESTPSSTHRPPPSPSEPICLSDSLDEDLSAPSLESISQALAVLSSAAKGLIQNDGPASPEGPRARPPAPPSQHASPLLQKKSATPSSGPHYVPTSSASPSVSVPPTSMPRPSVSSPYIAGSPLAVSRNEALGEIKGVATLAMPHRHSVTVSPRPGVAMGTKSMIKPSSSPPGKQRPPPTASPLLPPMQKSFVSPGPHKALSGKTALPAPHVPATKTPQPAPQPKGPPTQDSPRAALPSAPSINSQSAAQQPQSSFITPMQATITKSPHSSAIIKLTPRPPVPTPTVSSPGPPRPPQTVPIMHQASPAASSPSPSSSSKTPAFRPPLSGVAAALSGYGPAAGQKTPSQVPGSAPSQSPLSKLPTVPGSSPSGVGQRQRVVGGTGQVAKIVSPLSTTAASPQLSQASASGLLGAAGPWMLGGLVPVSLPFQFPSLLNIQPPGSSGAPAPPVTNSAGFSLPPNLLKGLQSGSHAALPPHLQLAFSDVGQNPAGDLKRKPL
ncbi:ubinuclein-2b [Denticeps clupeoides]|uniref:Ubinuclein-2 n=1 Tax=Denticeps clupeoides TaxID=299321 RepID=A0AAY4C4J6_9TELE|nr:ubinuclein-2-like [Denticeps clupeoides]XP_028842172.1 ubinuclein-2-like [Denticeps clupeoides]